MPKWHICDRSCSSYYGPARTCCVKHYTQGPPSCSRAVRSLYKETNSRRQNSTRSSETANAGLSDLPTPTCFCQAYLDNSWSIPICRTCLDAQLSRVLTFCRKKWLNPLLTSPYTVALSSGVPVCSGDFSVARGHGKNLGGSDTTRVFQLLLPCSSAELDIGQPHCRKQAATQSLGVQIHRSDRRRKLLPGNLHAQGSYHHASWGLRQKQVEEIEDLAKQLTEYYCSYWFWPSVSATVLRPCRWDRYGWGLASLHPTSAIPNFHSIQPTREYPRSFILAICELPQIDVTLRLQLSHDLRGAMHISTYELLAHLHAHHWGQSGHLDVNSQSACITMAPLGGQWHSWVGSWQSF